MNPTIVLLPLDDRPVNYDYPVYLARSAGMELLLPPRDWLGNPWRASRHQALVDWLENAAQPADTLIVPIDTLAYGGLIPSRTSTDPLELVLERCSVLKRLKNRFPEKRILAFSVIQRISRDDSSEEENEYWAIYGSRIFRLSYLEHKSNLGDASPEETTERDHLKAEIPEEIYQHYRGIRARNHAVNRAMLDWLAEGIFDYLLLPQDDTADYGWNIAEARALQFLIRKKGLSNKAITYPGADEIACLLLARCVCQHYGFVPSVWPRYSSVLSPGVVTSYEDRPIHELLKAHLAPLGGSIAESEQASNLKLFIHAPVFQQGAGELQWIAWEGLETLRGRSPAIDQVLDELAGDLLFQVTRREMFSPRRSPEEFTRALLAALRERTPVAVADVAFVNGADIQLGNLLFEHPDIARLAGYSGWNTAGNTLGCVLAQAVIRAAALTRPFTEDQEQAHLEFLFLRFLEDNFYQSIERTRAYLEDLPALGCQPTLERIENAEKVAALTDRIATRLRQDAGTLQDLFVRAGAIRGAHLDRVDLPWQRLFEIGIEFHLDR